MPKAENTYRKSKPFEDLNQDVNGCSESRLQYSDFTLMDFLTQQFKKLNRILPFSSK